MPRISGRNFTPTEPAEPEAEEPKATTGAADQDAGTVQVSLPQGFNLDNLPPEVVAQIPENIKQMLASGDMQGLMGSMGGAPAAMTKKPSGPAFSKPVSGEAGMLSSIAGRSTEPELAYATDEAAGSATEEAAELLPDSRVVGAFHNLAAETLLDPDQPVHCDVLVTGRDDDAKRTVRALAEEIEGVRSVDAGPLRYSRFVEGLTILLVGINIRYKARTHIQISGLEE